MVTPLSVLVVDDEALARKRLVRMLGEIAGATVVGEAADGEEAAIKAVQLKADVLLLDIDMPLLDGLTLAERSLTLPSVIFCTAHSEHAVQAFELNAVDYLLKPVRLERLVVALDKARARRPDTNGVLKQLAPLGARRVLSSSNGTVTFFDIEQINRFWSSQKYTVFQADHAEQLTEESLTSLEERVGSAFARVHRSELVRISAVQSFEADEQGHFLQLSDGQQVRISRRSLSATKMLLGLKT